MTSAKSSPTEEAIHVLLMLQQHGQLATAEVAQALQVDRRHARRLLKRLSAFAPIQPKGSGRDRLWVLDPVKGHINLTIYDQIALEVGRDATSFLDGTPLAETFHRASTNEGVPRRIAENYQRKIRVKSEPAWLTDDRNDALHDLLDGLLRERTLNLSYQARNGVRTYPCFRPLTLVAYRRVLYLMGFPEPDHDTQVHRLRVDRIESIEVGEPFDYPSAWDPDQDLDRWFGIEASGQIETVVLEFSQRAADLIRERTWHASQRLEPLEDGRIRLVMQTGGKELIRFALEWGEHCKVVSPPWLRDTVRKALKEALDQYR
ncbi:MAG: WYL domain-containing transcriptional regulator [Deltaproteobacteria bacterium]|nr:MAG: WYL domain-containing transcriptional regulator [Deltaproteobacteria bacterium]